MKKGSQTDGKNLPATRKASTRKGTEVVKPEVVGATPAATDPEKTPADVLLREAVSGGADKETIELIAKLVREEREDARRVAYDEAMARVQQQIPKVVADATNDQTGSRYAKTHTLNAVLRPIYGAEGFAIEFDEMESPKEGMTRYTAACSRAGHTRHFHVDLPPDAAGIRGQTNKTPIHALKSSGTYGQGILLRRIFNLVEQESDDDGNAAGPQTETVNAAQLKTLKSLAGKAGKKTVDRLLTWAKVDRLEDLPRDKFADACRGLNGHTKGSGNGKRKPASNPDPDPDPDPPARELDPDDPDDQELLDLM